MLTGLLFHSVILMPLMNGIFASKRLTQTRKLIFIGILLLVVASVTGYLKAKDWNENYFHILSVPRSADSREIKQAYRKLTVDLHPDKNPSEWARERFLLVTKAQNVLLNNETRDAYDRWGDIGVKWVETSQSVYSQGLTSLALGAFTQLVLVFILTAGVGKTNARAYSFGFLGLAIAVVANLRFGEDDIYIPFAPSTTKHEKSELIESNVALVVLAICSWQRSVYYDFEEFMIQKLLLVEEQQRQILVRANLLNASTVRQIREGAVAPEQPPARQGFRLPEIPSWMYLLLLVGASQLFGGKD